MERPVLLKSITAWLAWSKTSFGKTEGPALKLWIIAVAVFTFKKLKMQRNKIAAGYPKEKAGLSKPGSIYFQFINLIRQFSGQKAFLLISSAENKLRFEDRRFL